MIFGTRSRSKRSVALALAVSLLLPSTALLLLPVCASAQTAAPSTAADLAAIQIPTVPPVEAPIHTVLLFPFVNKIAANSSNGFDANIVGARIENAIKMRLNVIGRYKADSFSPTLPQIQRAVTESGVNGLTETDVAPPYDSARTGRRLADEIATDGYLLGTVEAIDVNTQSRTVSVEVTATLYSTETGLVVKTLAATGHGISYNTTDDPAALLQSAINDASGHIVSALNADRMQGQFAARPDVGRHHHSSIGTAALGLLLAAAIAIGITASHHGHHNSSSSTGTTGTGTGTGTGGGTTVGSGNPPPPPTTTF